MDVLWWIRGRGRDFRPFLANRIGEIQMHSNPVQWQHVPTDQNPADLCSRGASLLELAESSLWWNGPKWLIKPSREWPRMQLAERLKDLPEAKPIKKREGEANSYVTVQTAEPSQAAGGKQWRLDPTGLSVSMQE